MGSSDISRNTGISFKIEQNTFFFFLGKIRSSIIFGKKFWKTFCSKNLTKILSIFQKYCGYLAKTMDYFEYSVELF